MGDRVKTILEVLMEYEGTGAPKNLKELPELEQQCRDSGKEELADVLENWRMGLNLHIQEEWEGAPVDWEIPAPEMCFMCNSPVESSIHHYTCEAV